MYFNDVHILIYVGIAIIGLIVGKWTAWCNMCLAEDKKIISKDFFKSNKEGLEKNYIFMLLTAIIYIALVFKMGVKDDFFKNLDLVKYLVLTPMLECAFFVDIKHRLLPNRLNLTIFEIGLIFAFVYGINNINMAKDMILGMVAGAGIFIIITLLRRINYW